MKYRNHARVRAATRAGEPVPPCARARSGSHASLGRPAGNVLTFSSILRPVEPRIKRFSFSSRRFARSRRIFDFQFRRGVCLRKKLLVKNLKKRM